MLTLARELSGLTQKELVDRIPGLNQGNYSKMEKGLLNINETTLQIISEVLGLPLSFFSRPTPQVEVSQHFYRKKHDVSVKDLKKFVSKTTVYSMVLDELLNSIEIPEFNVPKLSVSEGLNPQVIANRIRYFMKIPQGPIENLVRRLESHGIIVIFIDDAPEGFDGRAFFTPENYPVIMINNDMANDRKRFTLAHELGHLVMHLRFDVVHEEIKIIEKQANLFASEFLMPINEICSDFDRLTYGKLGILKSYWKCSKASIIYSAHYNGLIDDNRAFFLRNELSRNGERKNEKIVVELEAPILIEKLINAHLNDLEYTKDELISTLSINEEIFNNIYTKHTTFKKLKIQI